jgi:predicted nucleic acid-binding protein
MTSAAGPLYLDTSCLLKLFILEPDSAGVVAVLAEEARVVVSELARLEAETQLRARLRGGHLTKARHRRLEAELSRVLSLSPFELVAFPGDGLDRARHLGRTSRVHCRTLDLLHVAMMDLLGVRRLLTNDRSQAALASALGWSVITMWGDA